jgi:ATP/maltotriose-dependent transcriptional regulator MalT
LAGAVAFPAPFGGDVLAVLEFYTDERREFTPRLVGTLNEIGREIGRSITHQQTGGSGTPIRLTARELEVLEIAASGRNGPEIARTLHVSPETIKTHFDHIYKKLGVSERSGAVAEAMRLGWIK